MPERALIGLGSNLGDRKAHLDRAVGALCRVPGVSAVAVSRYRETPPVGGPGGQGAFLNAAASLVTNLDPEPLLDVLQDVERDAGRVRGERWGERTLDLDLLLFGRLRLDTPRLRLPHPRMALRRFVLAPLAEVAPDAVDPVTGRAVADLLANLDRRPSYVALARDLRRKWDFLMRAILQDSKEDEVRPFLERLCRALPGVSLDDEIDAFVAEQVTGSGAPWDVVRAMTTDPPDDVVCRRLAPVEAAALVPEGGWLATDFWFDARFLALDSLKSARPRLPRFRERFLEARAGVLPPTFVVARPEDVNRLGLFDETYAWQRPIGRDAPILVVDDFQSEAALSEVLSACAATRAG